MNYLRVILVHAALAGLFAAGSANASLVMIEPDDYAPSTNLSTNAVHQGVTLAAWSSDGQGAYGFSPVFAADDPTCNSDSGNCYYAVTGTSVFSSTPDGNSFGLGWVADRTAAYAIEILGELFCSCRDPFSGLLMIFDGLTDYVEISGRFWSDEPVIWAFDADLNLLGVSDHGSWVHLISDIPCSFRGDVSCEQGPSGARSALTTSFQGQTGAPNIAYALAGGWSASASLDQLRFNSPSHSVPEPATLTLLGIGLLCFGLARRRLT